MARKPEDVYAFGNIDVTAADIDAAASHNKPILVKTAEKMTVNDFTKIFQELLTKERPTLRAVMAPESSGGWAKYLPNLNDEAIKDLFVEKLRETSDPAVLTNPTLLAALPSKKYTTPEAAAMDRQIREHKKETGWLATVLRGAGLKPALPSQPTLVFENSSGGSVTEVRTGTSRPSAADTLIRASEPVTANPVKPTLPFADFAEGELLTQAGISKLIAKHNAALAAEALTNPTPPAQENLHPSKSLLFPHINPPK